MQVHELDVGELLGSYHFHARSLDVVDSVPEKLDAYVGDLLAYHFHARDLEQTHESEPNQTHQRGQAEVQKLLM